MAKKKKKKQKAKPKNSVRTDKWQLATTSAQKQLLSRTVTEYRKLVKALIGVIYTHWVEVSSDKDPLAAVEKLMHKTSGRPTVKYEYFGRVFKKFPSYYRRAAINTAIGQVSSFVTRYWKWQGGMRNKRTDAPPRLNANNGVYPNLYQGECVKFHDNYNLAEIKVFTGSDWIWITIPITEVRNRHLVATNERLSPSLIVNDKKCHLSVPFKINPKDLDDTDRVVAVDLGINTTATVTLVNSSGTVIARHFIHPARDIDRRDERLKQISRKARLTMGKTGKLSKGFCKGLYRKSRNINREIGQKVSREIVKIAEQHNAKVIVFENLSGWRPKGGKKGSTLKQRYHGWLHRRITELTEMKWTEIGGKVEYVNPAYTSKYAYDGSGEVKRDSKNYALATFKTGKQYNADLNGSLNIASRYWYKKLKLACGNGSEVWLDKNSDRKPRIPVTLSVLWNCSTSL